MVSFLRQNSPYLTTPSYLKNKLPPNRLPFLSNVFRDIKCRTDRYKSSFFPDAITSWNEFITHFEHLPTRDGLEKHFHSFFLPKAKFIFSLYDPDGLGFKLSALSQKHHNFADTPSDICICKQGVEDTKHFLISCPLYANHRAALVNGVNDILQKNNLAFLQNEIELYLYGHPLLIDPYNKEILLCTIRYIRKTNRFSKP